MRGSWSGPARYIADVLPTDHLLAFLVTVYVLILIPGPSVLFVVSRGVALGRRSAVATAVGNEIGFTVQLALVAVGVGSILARSDAVYTVVKLVGAAYLIVLGVRSIRDRKDLAAALNPTATAPTSFARTLREGFFVGVSNPKGVLIFTAVLPQFIDRSQGHTTLQLISLGLICVLVAMLSDGAWALTAGTARRWLGTSSRRLEGLSVGGGVSLVALGVGLAVTGRKD
jgi:threonine/homoserine/homoserine lactone efflux protein